MRTASSLLLLALSLVSASPARASDPEPRLAGAPPAEECALPFSPQTVDAKVQDLARRLRQLAPWDRKVLLAIMRQDSLGPADKELVIQGLFREFRIHKERDLLWYKNRAVPSDQKQELAKSPKVRELMRAYGTRDPLYRTPEFLVREIAELYSRIPTREQQVVALGSLPDPRELPPWGIEAMKNAFIQLGMKPIQAERKVMGSLNLRRLQFLATVNGKKKLVSYSQPVYFADFQNEPAVARFVSYLGSRISEGQVSGMQPRDFEQEDRELEDGGGIVEAEHEDLADVEPEPEPAPVAAPEPVMQPEPELAAPKIDWEPTRSSLARLAEAARAELEQSAATRPRPERPAGASAAPEVPAQAVAEFNRFFGVLREVNLERDHVIEVIRHLILIGGNLILIGPTGTAKTYLQDSVMDHILVDGKPSHAQVQFHQETTADEILGPFSPKQVMEQDVFARNYEEGIFPYRYVSWDEIDKARPKLYPSLFSFLVARKHRQAGRETRSPARMVIASANKFLSQLYTSGDIPPQEVQPYIDRYDAAVFVGAQLEEAGSIDRLAELDERDYSIPEETLEELRDLTRRVHVPRDVARLVGRIFDEMHAETKKEERKRQEEYDEAVRQWKRPPAPYKSTRLYSPRTLRKAIGPWIRSVAALRYLANPESGLDATVDDIAGLELFLRMYGPCVESCRYFEQRAREPEEQAQYAHIEFERSTLSRVIAQVLAGYRGEGVRPRIEVLRASLERVEQGGLEERALQEEIEEGMAQIRALQKWMLPIRRVSDIDAHVMYLQNHHAEIESLIGRFEAAAARAIEAALAARQEG